MEPHDLAQAALAPAILGEVLMASSQKKAPDVGTRHGGLAGASGTVQRFGNGRSKT
jgi:hypothetical protein